MWEGRGMFFLCCRVSALWRGSKFRMQIFRGKDYLLWKANTVLFLLVTGKLVNMIQPGRKTSRQTGAQVHLFHFFFILNQSQTLNREQKGEILNSNTQQTRNVNIYCDSCCFLLTEFATLTLILSCSPQVSSNHFIWSKKF